MGTKNSSLKSTLSVGLTNMLDSSCIVAGATGLTLWASAFNLSNFQVGLLGALSANAFGAAIGAIFGGRLSDKYGRKPIYTYDMLVYLIGTLIVTFSVNFVMLLLGFLVTGIAVGAGVPATWTYVSETSGTTNRARNMGLTQFLWNLGLLLIYVLGAILSPLGLLGTRILFGILTVVAFITWLLQRQLSESDEWLSQKRQEQTHHVEEHPYRQMFSNPVSVRSILFLAGVYVIWNLVASAMGFFMPYVYEVVGGLSHFESNLINIIPGILGLLATIFIFSLLADRVSHRLLFFIGAACGLVAWALLVFVGINTKVGLWTFLIIWGIHGGISAQCFYSLWSTELFPTQFRAASQGFIFFLVRGFAGIWSICFPIILGSMGFVAAGSMMVAFLAISLLIGTIWAPNTRGKSLDQITLERYGKEFVTKR
ncbi:MAG: MFS transporter [Sporolactobacillus sp.]|jgi:inositol transporter-like SP family MFS transporter|nr:MFS transporter [Sporolactobacillus sp.]